jgi:hypothetical protein
MKTREWVGQVPYVYRAFVSSATDETLAGGRAVFAKIEVSVARARIR